MSKRLAIQSANTGLAASCSASQWIISFLYGSEIAGFPSQRRMPWPAPGTLKSSQLAPTDCILMHMLRDCSKGTRMSAVPWIRRNGGMTGPHF